MRIGFAYDVHKLTENRKLILGGVEIPFERGLLGHSDADVLLHAITDALLGALALGDIGKHFPDTDQGYKDIDSRILLRKAFSIIKDRGYKLVNLDSVICAQKPKLQNYIQEMRHNIAADLDADIGQISVKATTEEHLGISGSEAGMTAFATVLIETV
ncbi:MAG TPA: 2-C-methyl-D-erythritol 2,4-cyclodiphosphate synthase [Candidatus Cloacimonadota bacterium]|nr:2-C-methyl-D-erythritol 2,4-cyclodiphosphate synthase [Candidatus Cloacimonadota bacterium]HOQ80504.1 2-C-methyl-D-erythritol 2,4-cyclodiphosphate synthase [Candidatus Cloacimonadota bacterium]HPK40682.1 2-C-methyl-D-erythritol 2,4-cyclodiphosphate synthase [Candidatus Cloacimonadota bacterium]